MEQKIHKGFIKDYAGNTLLPITRAELVLDDSGMPALHSEKFVAQLPDESISFSGRPGLITAAEKALLQTLNGNSGSGNGTISDIYAQLDTLFNIGLNVGSTQVKYFNNNKEVTPISFTAESGISVGFSDNSVKFTLTPLEGKTADTTVEIPVTNITVDKYGRVTNVSGNTTLNGITLNNSKASDIDTNSDETSIVNKKYVDSLFTDAVGIASGSLKFKGVLQSNDDLNPIINSLNSHINEYWKIGYDGGSATIDGVLTYFKKGDTLVVYSSTSGNATLVHIPSGDEQITTLSVGNGNTKAIDNKAGNLQLDFTGAAVVSSTDGYKAVIDIPILSADPNADAGAISRADYEAFKQYSAKSMSFTPTITASANNAYEIGKITLGDEENASTIYGQYNKYTFTLENGYADSNANPSKDPKLNIQSSALNDSTTFQFKGESGINIVKENNVVKVTANNTVDQDSQDYLEIVNGHQFKVKLGNGENEGLVNFSTLSTYVTAVHQSAAHFELIEKSLTSNNPDSKYQYGNQNLIDAVNITI
jgi:hypothetical protein